MSKILLGFLVLTLLLANTVFAATSTKNPFKYQPFSGLMGYQELQIGPGLYYVSFHGRKKHSIEKVGQAWQVRAAELCDQEASTHFVKLRYVFEPILIDDVNITELMSYYRFVTNKKTGTTYTPIFIPSSPSVNYVVNAPTISHHIRCVKHVSHARKDKQLFSVSEAIELGLKNKWLKKAKR